MDKKISIVIVVVCILLITNLVAHGGGIKTIPLPGKNTSWEEKDHLLLHFDKPIIHESGSYIYIDMGGKNSWLNNPHEPVLPRFTTTLTYPIGTKIDTVTCTIKDPQVLDLPKKIMPVPQLLPQDRQYHTPLTKEAARIYGGTYPYPGNHLSYQINVGLKDNTPVLYLSIQIYPFQYYPGKDMGKYTQEIKIEITHKPPIKSITNPDIYDLVIIAPSLFSDNLQDLINHKEGLGIKTKLVTVEDIYLDYDGRDDAEKIKYFIKNAIEQWGIQYVLLVGGMKGQLLTRWNVPVRYTHLDDNSTWENTYISDLYFADIYKYNDGATSFEDWDSNGNGIFGEWSQGAKDIIDLHPDVYVGRLPCRNKYEVDIVTDKIMRYETNTYGDEWFKRIVVIGGDTHNDNDVGTDYLEGQITCDKALEYMDGFEKMRIYVKGGDEIYSRENTKQILNLGAGFVFFSGHGNPMGWSTHPYNDFDTWIDFNNRDIRELENKEKLPVLIVEGCHNSQFDVSILRLLTDGIVAFYKGEATPECWGWLMTRKIDGGSIATIGYTGLSYGSVGDGPVDEVYDSSPDDIPDFIQYMSGWIGPHFFEVYNHNGKKILGETWGTTITDYVNTFPIDWSREWTGQKPYSGDIIDCKTVQEWTLFGDPSLKIGGYPH